MTLGGFALILLGIMSPLPALADCTSPAGVEADMYYNTTYKRVQYCDGTDWVNMGVSGAGTSDNLGDHIATTVLRSDTHNTDDLGTTAIRWKDGWFAGAVTAGSFVGSGASLTGITSAGITDSTITNADIATGGVTTVEILDSTIVSADIAANTITAGNIAANAVGTSELLNGSVTAAKLAAGVGGVSAATRVSCNWSAGSCTTAACPAGYFRSGCNNCTTVNATTCGGGPGGSGTCTQFCVQ